MEDPNDLELDELSPEGEAPPPADAADATNAADAATGEDETAPDQNHNQDDDGPRSGSDLEAVYDVPVQVSAVLGKATLKVSQLLKLGRGAVVELDRKVGEAIDIYINDRLVARGEVVVVEDRLGVTMTEIIKSDNR
ncbi:MAG: flagellar motor switch protein FliN [Proteobacteria bacterium]|nr:flagellar motor switch protein FliN [Pseudomonadota bacterium]